MNRFLLPSVILALTGCGQVVKEVRGQVFLDNEHAEKLVLVFWHVDHMQEPFGGGVTDEDGFYEIKPHDKAIFWQTGAFVVQVADPPCQRPYRKRITQPPLASVYWKSQTSPLRAEITAGANELPTLHLESGPPPALARNKPRDFAMP